MYASICPHYPTLPSSVPSAPSPAAAPDAKCWPTDSNNAKIFNHKSSIKLHQRKRTSTSFTREAESPYGDVVSAVMAAIVLVALLCGFGMILAVGRRKLWQEVSSFARSDFACTYSYASSQYSILNKPRIGFCFRDFHVIFCKNLCYWFLWMFLRSFILLSTIQHYFFAVSLSIDDPTPRSTTTMTADLQEEK